MYDIKWIRENPEAFDKGLERRGLPAQSAAILALDEQRRAILIKLQDAQSLRNTASKDIGKAKAAKDEATAAKLMADVAAAKDIIAKGEEQERQIDADIEKVLSVIPNTPRDDVPDGRDETGNTEVRKVGTPPKLGFAPKQHFEIGEKLGLLDFERAAKVSGSRFAFLKGGLARMERALATFMIDQHTARGYEEILPPYLVNRAAMMGTGQLPKFEDDAFKTAGAQELFLIPTAEVPVTNMAREQILAAEELPRRYVAHTPCFRSEAGAYGRDTRGMIRQHQFDKVELVILSKPADSYANLELLTSHAEAVLRALELPYRVMALCAGDVGFASAKTYDLEVWLPSQLKYREISSCSNCEAFQARRMQARWRNPDTGKPEPLHTLNGSGVAVGRALVAVLENYQNADGSVGVPSVLQPYMGGATRISPLA